MRVLFAVCTTICVVAVYSSNDAASKIAKGKEKPKQLNEECAQENGFNLKAMYHEIATHKHFVATQPIRCFVFCMYKKIGLMNEDTSLTQKFYDTEGAHKCTHISGNDECDTAYKIMECVTKHEIWFKVDY
uniref:Odorant-binding protein 29 n=1 Tax=Chouioia cunea TaxID=1570515 RepID=A0A6B9CJF7_9HYME|nr:odorant-binding protein 29 [Chouioia cunea]